VKIKRISGIFLALCLMLGLLAIMPVTASAAEIPVDDAAALESAFESAADGDTIRLTADITYNNNIYISGKTITLDLDGFTLTATAGLQIWSGGKVLLADPANGEFNVTGGSGSFNVAIYGSGAKAEITNAATATAKYAIYANDGEVIVFGDVKQQKAGATAEYTGAWVMNGAVIIEGAMEVAEGAAYAKFGPIPGTDKALGENTTPSTKPGYFTYVHGSYGSVWVKDPDYVPPPPKGVFGTKPQYSQWYHYILFFLCFGFIWMW